MDIEKITPELRKAARKIPRVPLDRPAVRIAARILTRLTLGRKVAGVERRVFPRERVRLYLPSDRSGAALLWFHGGGLVVGHAAHDDEFCAQTALATGAVVVSVNYRLAPRAAFPAALDDGWRAFQWLRSCAPQWGIDLERIAVGGQSAGGGLAACLVQRLHDEDVPVRAQWLWCPMLDDRTATDRRRDAANHFVWNNRMNRAGWTAYLGPLVGAERLPPYAAAARRKDLTGLPPTWLYAPDVELFFDEARHYAARLSDARVPTEFEIVSGAPHGFDSSAPESSAARVLTSKAYRWLDDQLAARGKQGDLRDPVRRV